MWKEEPIYTLKGDVDDERAKRYFFWTRIMFCIVSLLIGIIILVTSVIDNVHSLVYNIIITLIIVAVPLIFFQLMILITEKTLFKWIRKSYRILFFNQLSLL